MICLNAAYYHFLRVVINPSDFYNSYMVNNNIMRAEDNKFGSSIRVLSKCVTDLLQK